MSQSDWDRGPIGYCCRGTSWPNDEERTGQTGSIVYFSSDEEDRSSLRTAYAPRVGDGDDVDGEGPVLSPASTLEATPSAERSGKQVDDYCR
jgi:hypothetical protein